MTPAPTEQTPAPTRDVVIVTPWYPTPGDPYHGVFVRDTVAALRIPSSRIRIVHLTRLAPDTAESTQILDTPEGQLLRIGIPIRPSTARSEVARLQRDALLRYDALAGAEVIHAHVGLPTGWAAAAAAPAGVRLVVTEHATYLREELRTVTGRRSYGQVLERLSALLMVGEAEAERVRSLYPQHGSRVVAVGNPVRGPRRPVAPRSPGALDRWLYIGNLIPRKGVQELLESFALFHTDRPTAHLTLVGGGPLETALRERAAELGLAERVRFAGPQEPEDLADLASWGDVLVHLSAFETFGLTPVEAALNGLAVVVTRCGGPEETLLEAAAAGVVRFVPVGAKPQAVVAAVHSLESSPPDPHAARVLADLYERYAAGPWGHRVTEMLQPAGADTDGEAERLVVADPRVLVLANSPSGCRKVRDLVPATLRGDAALMVITNRSSLTVALDRRVRVLDIQRATSRLPLHLLESTMLVALPQLALGALEGLTGIAGGAPGRAGRAAHAIQRRVGNARAATTGLATRIHDRVLHPMIYAVTEPIPNARFVMRHGQAGIDDFDPTDVFYADSESLAIAWRLARDRPGLRVERLPRTIDYWDLVRPTPPEPVG
ncbi:glycosyltransferase family 4 protein [Occultella gossypii]|uniref:Glycosyltransferase family 4 protein n=1 Tax=Occultella gossypii TaxID=2800820 RepID=A0ABS7S7Y0_9MICO|nr:glycosyltransferase family 4 protein [Occultella gossypii]MBZ2196454.1 glycosyltransferase family 4 protein [Occultella gossypii]